MLAYCTIVAVVGTATMSKYADLTIPPSCIAVVLLTRHVDYLFGSEAKPESIRVKLLQSDPPIPNVRPRVFKPQNIEFRSAGPARVLLLRFEIHHATFCGSLFAPAPHW